MHAGQHPNDVGDADIDACRQHYDDDEIAAIIAVCALFGFLNRWNDSLATELEPVPLTAAPRHLEPRGWSVGKHASTPMPSTADPRDGTRPIDREEAVP